MKTVIYEYNNSVVVATFLTTVDLTLPYYEVDPTTLPKEPIETWYIKDGEIKIDQEKLIEHNRDSLPSLSPIEFDIKLNNAGLYDQVQGLIQSDVKLKIAYTRATFFSRTDPFIDQARIALNLTDEQVDSMWQQALTL